MKKGILWAAALAILLACADKSSSQDSGYRTIVLSGTADVLIDSSMTVTNMAGRRLYINGIYAWWDNAANTNQVFVEVVRSVASMATQGSGRQFKYSEAMTSGGIKGVTIVPNVITAADSALYFVIQATGSDSLFLAINFKYVN